MGLNVERNDSVYSVLNLDEDDVTGLDRLLLVKKDLGARSGMVTLETIAKTVNNIKGREDISEGGKDALACKI